MITFGGKSRRVEIAAAVSILVFAGTGVGTAVAASASEDRTALRMASLLFRHSVISPKYNPPKLKTEWPMGYRQLTAIGIQRTYESGLALRRRYVEELALLSAGYKMPEVYFRASNTDRSLQTAQVLALGLFPLGTGPDPSVYDITLKAVPTPELSFTPVPIHSVGLENDSVMRPWTSRAGCQKYRRYLNLLSKTKLYRAQAKRFSPFLQRISAITGINEGKKSAKILYEINEVYESLSSNVAHNLPLPETISAKDLELLRLLSDWNYHHQFLGKKIGRLTGGPFVGEVVGNFSRYIKQPDKARRLYVYSGHQRTVLGVEAALGIETARTEGPFYKGRVPPLGSHYAFELHERAKGAYAVRLKFISEEGEKAITIPGCGGEFCPFNRFRSVAAEGVPKDWRTECEARRARRGFFGR